MSSSQSAEEKRLDIGAKGEGMFLKRLLKFWNKDEKITHKLQDMTYFIENEKFVDYPLCWRDCSCSGRNDLIHYLNSNEKLFKGIVNREYDNRIIGIMTDILSIDGISCSQSPVEKFANLDEFSLSLKKDAKKLFSNENAIEFFTNNDFENNCNFIKKEQHKLHNIVVQVWNNKKYISNDNCSHHLAAIYRQCKEQGRVYQLSLDIIPESINLEQLKRLINKYYLVFSDISNLDKIGDKYNEIFHNESLRMHDYRRYEKRSYLFPLNKDVEFNQAVVDLLKEHSGKFLILNDELERLYL